MHNMNKVLLHQELELVFTYLGHQRWATCLFQFQGFAQLYLLFTFLLSCSPGCQHLSNLRQEPVLYLLLFHPSHALQSLHLALCCPVGLWEGEQQQQNTNKIKKPFKKILSAPFSHLFEGSQVPLCSMQHSSFQCPHISPVLTLLHTAVLTCRLHSLW